MKEYKRINVDNHIVDIMNIYDTYVVYFQYNNNYSQTKFFYNLELKKFLGFNDYKPTQRQLNYIENYILKMI